MRLRIGGSIRPLNECVAQISYKPVYDITRLVTSMTERWDITGRLVLYPNASQSLMTAALEQLKRDMLQERVDLVFLEDGTNRETALALWANECFSGPTIVDYGFPNASGDNYATGVTYRVTYEAMRPAGFGSNLLEFTEKVSEDPGGEEHVYVGGAVNFAERQLGTQNKTFKYRQSGSAVGLFATPRVPPPLWPYALTRPFGPIIDTSSPRVLGTPDTEYAVSWEYEYEWHQKLYGKPHRRS